MSDQRITVLHLVNTLEFGGVYRHVMDLASGLSAYGIHSVFAAWAPPESPLHDDTRFTQLPLYRGDSRNRSLPGILRSPGMIRSIIRRENVDILHSHSRLAAMLSAAAIPLLPGVRRLHTVHTNFNDLRLFPFYPREMIAVSEGLASAFRARMRFVRGSRINVIHNGITLPGDRVEADPTTEFLFVGRLVEQKGVPLLLEALDRIDPGDAISVRICGDGPLWQEVRTAADRGSPITYEGFCTHPFKRTGKALALLFPSDALEGLGYVVLEAFARGIPVIANDIPVLRGLVDHARTGVIVLEPNPEAWVKALREAVRHADDMRAMGQRGKETVASLYRMDAMIQKTAAVYRRLFGE